jgi:hypothetical protein
LAIAARRLGLPGAVVARLLYALLVADAGFFIALISLRI